MDNLKKIFKDLTFEEHFLYLTQFTFEALQLSHNNNSLTKQFLRGEDLKH
jgi:hypothetical protein